MTGGLILAGAATTAGSLVLPTTADMLIARVLLASLGVLLTSLGGVLASNLATQASTSREVEQQHVRFLGGVARNLATIYHGLQDATAKRRNGAFQHEETYQESVLMSANAILADYDAITALSGRLRGAFKESKSELDEISNVFSTEYLFATTSVAAQRELPAPTERFAAAESSSPRVSVAIPEPVMVACPICGSRVTAAIAPRAGWTVASTCSHCKTRFLIHRKADLTVYAGKVIASTSLDAPAAPADAPQRRKPTREYGPRFTTACATCGASFSVAPPTGLDRPQRVCIECGAVLEVDSTTQKTRVLSQGEVHSAAVIDRDAYFPIVHCDQDDGRLKASFLRADGSFAAVCTIHSRTFSVKRSDFRAWLRSTDPGYLEHRLAYEANGGLKRVSD